MKSNYRRVSLWLVVWLMAYIALVILHPRFFVVALVGFYFFPIGLLGFFLPPDWQLPEIVTYSVVAIGWTIYAGLSYCFLMRQERFLYVSAFICLVALLVFNVAGCHVEIGQMK